MDIENNISVKQERKYCAAYFKGYETSELGCAEASLYPNTDGIWYLNRILVQPEKLQGKGIGSALIRKLQDILVLRADFKKLVVEPEDEQKLFFLRNSFELVNSYGIMEWIPDETA